MLVGVEGYLLINLAMNLLLIAICARAQRQVRVKPIVFAAAFGALYAWAMYLPVYQVLRTLPMRLGLSVALAAIALDAETPVRLLKSALLLIGCTALMGGVATLALQAFPGLPLAALSVGALGGAGFLLYGMHVRARRVEQWEVQLILRTRHGQVRLSALVDTGNRLHEPISGLPVVIVEEKRVRQLFPPGFEATKALEQLPPGFRMVGYGALGGQGRLVCFRPDEVLASYGDGWMRAPDVWVALYPGIMPGEVHALAPTVIGTIQSTQRERVVM